MRCIPEDLKLFQEIFFISGKKTLISFKIGFADFNAFVVVAQLFCEGPIHIIECENIQETCYNVLHIVNVFKITALRFSLSLGNKRKSEEARYEV